MASAAGRGARARAAAGVDNTNNVRVWPAEHVMLHTLLRRFGGGGERVGLGGARVLELGGGMSALAGLGLAACCAARARAAAAARPAPRPPPPPPRRRRSWS